MARMMRRALVILAGLAALLLVLGALDVVELPFGLLRRGPDAGEAETLEAPAEDRAGGAELTGVGRPAATAEPPPLGSVAHGTVLRGAVIVGRVVEAGVTPLPVEGARVRLMRPHPVTAYLRTPSAGRWDVLEAKTDELGRFRFADVRPARGYVVRATLPGRAAASSARLDLTARQVSDVGDLAFGPAGEIAGRVLAGDRRPVAGARVAVTWKVDSILGMVVADPSTLPEREAEAESDELGRFRLGGLEAGRKTIVLDTAAHGRRVLADVEVGPGQRLELEDVVLAGRGVVAGRVEWDDGSPVHGARVFAGEPVPGKPTLASALTGADGAFRLEHLDGEAARLGVFVPGIPVEPTDDVPMGTLDLVLRLARAGAVTGRVVRRKTGEPVTRFGLRLEPVGDEAWMARAVRRLIDAAVGPEGFAPSDGRFLVPFHASGTWIAVVSADGFPDTRTEPFQIVPRERADVGSIALAEGHTLTGSVRTRTGERLAAAEIHLLGAATDVRVEGADILNLGWDDPVPEAASDAEGAFVLPPQTPGRYALLVRHPHAVPRVVAGVDLTSGSQQGFEVVLEPAGEVRVRVLDARGGPAAHEDVLLVRPDGFALDGTTDEDGQLHWRSVAAGPCLVRWASLRDTRRLRTVAYSDEEAVRREAYDALLRDGPETFVRAGEPTDVALILPSRVSVTIRVTRWTPDPGAIERLIVGYPQGYWRVSAGPSAEGAFQLELEPGTYEMRAVPSSGWEQSRIFEAVTIPDAPSHTVDLGR
jgi:hypothetical protein